MKRNLKMLQTKTKCPNILIGTKKEEATQAVNFFPEDFYATNTKAKENAKTQTDAARTLLSAPKGAVLYQLKTVAEAFYKMNTNKLETYWQNLQDEKKNSIMNQDVNRQLMTGILKDGTRNMQILAVVGRVRNGNGNGNDNAAILGFLGDIGGLLFDTYADQTKIEAVSTDTEAQKEEKAKKKSLLQGVASQFFTGTPETCLESLFKKVSPCFNKLSGKKLYPNKAAERGNCIKADKWLEANINPRKDTMLVPRKGLLGLATDENINPVSWPWQTLPKAVMDKCIDEPFIGHFSGSIVELLFMLDLFAWDDGKRVDYPSQPDLYLTQVNKSKGLSGEERKARAALAASFLLGMGMHSAVEVSPTIRHYLGLNAPAVPIASVDAISNTYCDQTKFIAKLITEANKETLY